MPLRLTSLNLQKLFVELPHPARSALVAGQSLKNRLTRYGAEYRRTSALLRESQYWSTERLRLFQSEQLLRLLVEAKAATRHYSDALAGFSQADLVEIAHTLDVSALPILEKKVLKAETSRFFNKARATVLTSSTSGSTGSPLVVEYDRASIEQRFAHFHRMRAAGGVGAFDRDVRMSGRQLAPSGSATGSPWILNPFERMLLVSTYHLDEHHLPRITKRIAQFRPALIDGYPTAVEQLARHCAAKGIVLPSLRMIIVTAETLSPEMRRTIEAGLGVRVFDYYGASEGVPFICQCEAGAYHVWLDSGFFEFLREDGSPAGPGEIGEIVVTPFCQWKTPLIRYKTGDLAALRAEGARATCPCGRAFPMVESILGRVEDLVLTRDGRSIGMFAYRTLKHVPGIREAQITQRAWDRFSVRLAPDGTRPVADVHRDIERIFESVVGYRLGVDVQVVDAIERGPNGKFRSVVRAFDSAAS